jgi:hypothetical protein
LKNTLLLGMLALAVARGQQTPVLGFAGGGGGVELRALLGIPGAARFSDPVPVPPFTSLFQIAPGHRYAVVEQAGRRWIGVMPLDATTTSDDPQISPLPFSIAPMPSVIFSPTGTAAAFYSQIAGKLQTISNLPQGQFDFEDYSSSLPSTRVLIAISDDAQRLLLADTNGTVYLLTPNSSPSIIYQSTDISAIAFIPNGHAAIIADRSLNAVLWLQDVGAGSSGQVIASAADGILYPQAIAVTGDGAEVMIGDSTQPNIWLANLNTGTVVEYGAPSAPSMFDRARDANTFLVSPPSSSSPKWLLTWDGTTIESFLIPSLMTLPRSNMPLPSGRLRPGAVPRGR